MSHRYQGQGNIDVLLAQTNVAGLEGPGGALDEHPTLLAVGQSAA